MLIQYLLLAIIVAAIGVTWWMVGRGRFNRRAAAGWTALWVAGLAVVLFPELASRTAAVVGIGRGADAVVYLSIVGLFWLVFRIFVRLERQEREMTKLVRRMALDEADKAKAEKDYE